MSSSPKKGSEFTSANALTNFDLIQTSKASENQSRVGMAGFIERLKALLATKKTRLQVEAQSTIESAAVSDDVPRDANQRIINPGGRMILTPPDTQDEQTASGRERGSF